MNNAPHIVMIVASRSRAGLSKRASAVSGFIKRKHGNKHSTALMLVLSMTIATWGFASKVVSNLQHDLKPAVRVSLAKLWVERRTAEIVVHQDHVATSRIAVDLQSLAEEPHSARRSDTFLISIPSGSSRASSPVLPLLPSRAPPSMPNILA